MKEFKKLISEFFLLNIDILGFEVYDKFSRDRPIEEDCWFKIIIMLY